ncbi:hypothetical protein K6R70_004678 [Salmonella enterica]|nr:hypothetical protein [Salmonella enterica]EHZ8363787.1 hypothetical protein [Salmonella enterica]
MYLTAKGGEWLLDPVDVTIVGTGTDSNIDSTTNAGIFTPTASGAQILNSSIVSQLNAGTNVTVKTSGADVTGQTGNITVNADIIKNSGADAKLTMAADGNITLDAKSITSTVGKLDVSLLAAGQNSGRIQVVNGSTINSNGGNITIDHAADGQAMTILISGSTLNASATGSGQNGNITLRAYNPNVDLTVSSLTSTMRNGGSMIDIGNNSNLTGDNITTLTTQNGINGKGLPLYMHGATLQADGNISLSGVSGGGATPAQLELRGAGNRLTSVNGNISLISDKSGVLINATGSSKANITSGGNITFSGNGGSSLGVGIINASINATDNIHITGSTTGGGANSSVRYGGIYLFGNVEFHASHGTLTGNSNTRAYDNSGGVVMGSRASGIMSNVLFDGNFNINGTSNVAASADSISGGLYYNGNTNITFSGGNSVINARGMTTATAVAGVVNGDVAQNYWGIKLQDGANLIMNLTSSTQSALMPLTHGQFTRFSLGYDFSGKGNVTINAQNNGVGYDSATLQLNRLRNVNLDGAFTVNATNSRGTAILVSGFSGLDLVNATITGTSRRNGPAIIINSTRGNVNLNNVTLNGISSQGNGISVSGNGNTSITNSTLNGISTSGNGSGVVLTAGSNYTLDGGSITGRSVNGYGVLITGALTVNNGTSVTGTATGSGNGVSVSGNLATVSGDGIQITGKAASGRGILLSGNTVLTGAKLTGNAATGTGVNVSGNATLTNATVSGETQTGTGAVVTGNLTADSSTQVTGKATQDGGTGVTLNGTVTGGKVDGVSEQGTGLQLADNVVVTDATLKGTSTSGSGVAVTGNISLDDTTATALNATSGSGAGLSLEDSANVSIVSITTVTQEKKGPDGNTVTDATGNPVLETITMTTPVTTPVTLTGTSQSGSGVATSGNVSISGVVLNGSSTSAGGAGATLGGNLTIADDISGITVNATGNGTGLVVDNVTVNADGYTSIGKNFVINASTSDSSGTAIRAQGNNQLAGVTLNGSAGNGGTAVVLGGQVSGASVTGTSDSGTAVRVSDARLTNTVVTGNATGNGSGVALSGAVSLDKTTAEALNAVSSGGTGLSLEQSANVSVAGLDAVSTAELKGLSQSGSGITTAGNVAIRGIVLNGSTSTDSGVGVTLGGNLTIGDDVSRVTAGATGSGTALVIDNATLQANGYAGTNKGPVILADASGAGGTAVKIQGDNQLNDVAIVGNATSDGGTGVLLDGQVTGANILGTAGSGTGVVVTDGTLMDGGTVKGRSHNGTGLAADGNVTLNHALISGDAQGDSGTGVSLNGSITGGTVNGTSTSGDAVRIKDALFTGTEVNGVAQSGTGVKTQGNVTLKSTELSATSENGITDLDVSGALNRDQYSVINAARIEGRENIHEPQPDTPPSPGEGGATGSGGNTTPDTGDSGGVAGSDTGSGESGETVTPPPGGNGGDAGNNGNTGSATGGEGSLPENNVALRGEVPGAAIREQMTGQMFASVLRQQAVNALVTRMNQAAQDGFHSAATPVVPVTGYQAKPQNVEISLCDEDSCQPESLNTARPAQGVVTSSASGK